MNDIGGNGGRVYWISATPYVHYIFWAANLIFDAFFFSTKFTDIVGRLSDYSCIAFFLFILIFVYETCLWVAICFVVFFVVQAYDFVSCFLVAPLANVTRETKRHSLLSTTMEKVVMRQG